MFDKHNKSVRKDRNLNKKRLSEEEILDYFPKEDFIVVFGTSNSFGSCVNGDKTDLEYDEIWCNILGKELGYPIFNLSQPGTTNERLIKIISDFTYYYKKQSAKCVLAIGELRFSTFGFLIQNHQYDLYKDTKNEKQLNPAITHTKDIHHGSFDTILYYAADGSTYKNSSNISDSFDITSYKRFKPVYEYMVDKMYSTDAAHILEYENIFIMQQFLEGLNIPFKWFTWNQKPRESTRLSDEIKTLFEQKGLKESNLLGGRDIGAQYMLSMFYSKEWVRDTECECGHNDENFHRALATLTYGKLKNEFTRKNN